MKIRKFMILLPLFLLLVAGCAEEQEVSEDAYHIEYLNKDKTKIVKVEYEPRAKDTSGLVEEFLNKLETDPESVEYRKAMPTNVSINSYGLEGALLTLHFTSTYSSMDSAEEVLCRAAIVRTMTQIEGIDCVTFYVGDTPLADGDGNIVGAMTEDSFIENPGEQINSIQNAALTLYFSNETGNGLVKETRDVYYSSNISMEKLIMEQLLDGPTISGAKSAIPDGTNLVNVSVVEGVCYVSLDETFRNQNYEISEAIVIYSIVNSLSELPTISRVQISVNGDTSGTYRDSFALEMMYNRDLDYLEASGAENAVETEEVE